MDAFYASIEQQDQPVLRGRAVLVGGAPDKRGVVAAASYEARAFGCRSAMPMKTAIRKCPEAFVISPRFSRYREVSRQVLKIFRSVTPIVETISLDEAFLDISDLIGHTVTPRSVAEQLRREIRKETNLTVSCGVATSKSVAKIASDINKPNGITVVLPGEERTFLAERPVNDLWGIGPKTTARLKEAGIAYIGDLARTPIPWLMTHFGVRGEAFHNFANGIDQRPVENKRESKSISSEQTFSKDVSNVLTLSEAISEQAKHISQQLRNQSLRARTIQIKLRLSDFTTYTRQCTLKDPTEDKLLIESSALTLLRNEIGKDRYFRLVGTGVTNLSHSRISGQLELFFNNPNSQNQPSEIYTSHTEDEEFKKTHEKITAVIEQLQKRFGTNSINRGEKSKNQATSNDTP